MAGLGIKVNADFGATGWASGAAADREAFVAGAGVACVLDPSFIGTLWQDREGTVPVTAAGQPVRRITDRSGQGRHAILRAAATGTPTYATDGVRHWVDIPIGGDFEIASPLAVTNDVTVVMGLRLTGVSSATTYNFLSQGQSGSGTPYLALYLARYAGNLASNLNTGAGLELTGDPMSVDADHVVNLQRAAAGTAQCRLDGAAWDSATYTPQTGSGQVTRVFASTDASVTVSGRLYYLAFVSALRDPDPLTAIATSRIGA